MGSPETLFRMLAIALDVNNTVNDVIILNGTKGKTNCDPEEGIAVEKLTIKDNPGIDDSVFRPLFRAHRAN